MRLWRNSGGPLALLGLAGMAYPIMLYYSRDTVPPPVFVIAGLSLMLLRAAFSSQVALLGWRKPLLAALVPLLAMALIDAALAARFYPVAMSLAAAAAFGITLISPPSLIERLARLREPDLPPAAITYCRAVTWLWTLWLLLNAAVAAFLALAGMDAAWAAWTGVIAYLVGGTMLAGEWLFRRHFRTKTG